MSETTLLSGIQEPADLRKLSKLQAEQVAGEIRDEIIDRVSRTGGHLASSLGAVELLTAIHYVFNTPTDRLVLDVGHQGYPHKMLTGRRDEFDRIGKAGGIAKFLRRSESKFDAFGAGHAGTSISAALGMARAMEHQGRDSCAIALIGDGGMTAGMAFEALNHSGHLQQKNLVVVLNDNEMSISPNVGAMSSYLSRKLSNPLVRRIKGFAKEFLGALPGDMLHWAQKAEESLKVFFSPGLIFEALNFNYVGPIQGHRMDVVLETFENVKQMIASGDGPVLVHAITSKGYGYEPAQQDPFKYHGVGAFDVESGRFHPTKPGPPKYQNVFADALIELAKDDERIIGITAAMADGTGLDRFEKVFGTKDFTINHVAKATATFERTILSGNAPYDRYKAGDKSAMSESQVRGMNVFFKKTKCDSCHLGFNFTDSSYVNVGIGMDKPNPDLGRFNVSEDEEDKGAFKTPTLREIANTGPYMHDGRFKTLEEVIEHYDSGGVKNPYLDRRIKPLELAKSEKRDLVAFLKALSGVGWQHIKAPEKFPE